MNAGEQDLDEEDRAFDAWLAAINDRATADALALLQRDPTTAPDDPELVDHAIDLGMMSLIDGREDWPFRDDILAWLRYADSASPRVHSPDSDEPDTAAYLLRTVLTRRQDFPAALAVQRRLIRHHHRHNHHLRVRDSQMTFAELLQTAGQCDRAAGAMDRIWRAWQRSGGKDRRWRALPWPTWPRQDGEGLKIVMRLVVGLATCGQTDAAARQVTAAAPFRPHEPRRDHLAVRIHYGSLISEQWRTHRPHCTRTATGIPSHEWLDKVLTR
ncbi:hypothetical protein AB0M46_21510 [Dactylosporangium sp. NPDC051485]|uniref:hypothetical protein n=1 Tax=Dactylosporangium sp. NPDC051485 TaxID=3154846 RepID=UPI00341B8B37